MRLNRLLALAGFWMLACAPEAHEAPESITRVAAVRTDSAGLEIVHSMEPWWGPEEGWSLSPSPDLRIGSVDGGGDTDFVRIRDILVLPDGRIVVGDDGTANLRVFSPQGAALGTVGRRGSGPGEFGSVRMIRRIAGDSVVVFDWSEGRMMVLTSALEPVRTYRTATRISGITLPHVKAVTASGVPIMTGARPPWVEDPVEYYGQPQHLLIQDEDGSFDREIAQTPGKGYWGVFYETLGERILTVHGGTFEVLEYDLEGVLRRRIRGSRPSASLPEEFFEEVIDLSGSTLLTELSNAVGQPIRMQPRQRDPDRYPETVPAIDDLLVDQADHIWVRHGTWPEEGARDWSVFRPDGQWLGIVTTPEFFTPMEITSTHVFGVLTDELDVQYVASYLIRGRQGG